MSNYTITPEMSANKYIVAGYAIYATGDTPELAFDQYLKSTGCDEDFDDVSSNSPFSGKTYICRATQALYDLVEDRGGDVPWDIKQDGIGYYADTEPSFKTQEIR